MGFVAVVVVVEHIYPSVTGQGWSDAKYRVI